MLSHTMPHVRVLHAVTNNKFHICKKLTGKYYNFAKRKGQRDSPGDYKFSFNVKNLKSMAICKCPAATALPNIPNFTCAESFGQIQKVAFQRLYKSTGEKIHLPRRRVLGKKRHGRRCYRQTTTQRLLFPRTFKHQQQKRAHPVHLEEETKRWEVLRKL